jgi:hypothetical protein
VIGLGEADRYLFEEFKAGNSPLKAILEQVCAERAAEYNRKSAEQMRQIPRNFEAAADYAAKAEVYETFMADLMEA